MRRWNTWCASPATRISRSSRRSETRELAVTLVPETDPFKLAEARPASSWLGALDLGDRDTKLHFQTQCTFCHQQGNAFIRLERTPEEWSTIITRMMRYGSRLSTADQKTLPELLSAGFRKLRENPQLVADPAPWSATLTGIDDHRVADRRRR